MASNIYPSLDTFGGGFFVPGTCVVTPVSYENQVTTRNAAGSEYPATPEVTVCESRDPAMRLHYAKHALAAVPRLLGAIDRNPYRETYGCLDRQFWHYRTAAFPSEMYQEGALPLALAFSTEMPDNRWFQCQRVRELAVAAIHYAARSSRADGSCDDYYPFERALGAAVFSLQATTRAYQVLELDDGEILAWFQRRADWIIDNDESGRLTNHHALAALGLLRVADISGQDKYRMAAEEKIGTVLDWQHDEGWFDEYGGADPGYQTVTIDSLAKIRRESENTALDDSLGRAVRFAREFLHPDSSYAGEYGSRGTYHFYPHGMELLAADGVGNCSEKAADLADGFLESLAHGTVAHFDDDRLFAHRLGNLFEAYQDWAPRRPVKTNTEESGNGQSNYYPAAGMLVHRMGECQSVISTARGGVFKHFSASGENTTDAGLIVETTDGRIAVSQLHDRGREVEYSDTSQEGDTQNFESLTVTGPLHWIHHETLTPLKQAIFHAGMVTMGRWCRGQVRRLLQRRLITGRSESDIRLTRRFEFRRTKNDYSLRVIDSIELTDPKIKILRMSLGSDHQSIYVAASGVYQDSCLIPWTDLDQHVAELNINRRVVICRKL
ncbi:MAG: hypothetical protein JXM70_14430 [Pirellulales bacterium]|nr:hypothetical protein [Pirellulales bacterium]